MYRRIASLTGLLSLTVLGWLLSAGPAAAQYQGYPVSAQANGAGGAVGLRSGSIYSIRGPIQCYYTPAYPARAPVSTRLSYYNAPAESSPVNKNATLNLLVPIDAQVSIEGSPMSLAGWQRRFESPPLEPGRNYTYDIQVSWVHGGREVTHNRHVTVHAGDVINLTIP
jgi:uncharacterized protein (TIGR03000 family)